MVVATAVANCVMRVVDASVLVLLLSGCAVDGATVMKHKWDTVADLMGMHGQGGTATSEAINFAAKNYGQITTAAPCEAQGPTMEDGTLQLARKLKAANPATLVGMYWRTDMVSEIAKCSNFTAELKATGNSTCVAHGVVLFSIPTIPMP